jgi:hypothetical protein
VGGINRRRFHRRDLQNDGTHGEAIEIEFDPKEISSSDLLVFLFRRYEVPALIGPAERKDPFSFRRTAPRNADKSWETGIGLLWMEGTTKPATSA